MKVVARVVSTLILLTSAIAAQDIVMLDNTSLLAPVFKEEPMPLNTLNPAFAGNPPLTGVPLGALAITNPPFTIFTNGFFHRVTVDNLNGMVYGINGFEMTVAA